MKRIGTIDGMANVLLTTEEWQGVRELPPPPVCFLCGAESLWLTALGYGSQYDGEHICPGCQDEAIRLLKDTRDWFDGKPVYSDDEARGNSGTD